MFFLFTRHKEKKRMNERKKEEIRSTSMDRHLNNRTKQENHIQKCVLTSSIYLTLPPLFIVQLCIFHRYSTHTSSQQERIKLLDTSQLRSVTEKTKAIFKLFSFFFCKKTHTQRERGRINNNNHLCSQRKKETG